jgi:citrate synthase
MIYQAIALPVEMCLMLFAIPPASGWLSLWKEMRGNPEQKIARPRQIDLVPGGRGCAATAKRENDAENGRR